MPLENFGSILNFAEQLESQDREFYISAAANPACSEHKEVFDQMAADANKNIKNISYENYNLNNSLFGLIISIYTIKFPAASRGYQAELRCSQPAIKIESE